MVASRESLENRKNSTTTRRLKASRSRGFNILGFIQRQMARILALDFQLDCLNYQAENWLHADLDFETFKMLQVIYSPNIPAYLMDTVSLILSLSSLFNWPILSLHVIWLIGFIKSKFNISWCLVAFYIHLRR